MREIGELTFQPGDCVEISCPTFDDNSGCKSKFKCKPGIYTVAAEYCDEGHKDEYIIGLYLYQSEAEIANLRRIYDDYGTDTGLSGFFNHKPDIDHSEHLTCDDYAVDTDKKIYYHWNGFYCNLDENAKLYKNKNADCFAIKRK